MSPFDHLLVRLLLASGGCLAAGLGVWGLTLLLRRLPGVALQRSTWLLAQLTIVAAFLVIVLPHSERLRIVPPIELDTAIKTAAAPARQPAAAARQGAVAPTDASPAPQAWLLLGARLWLMVYALGLLHALWRLLQARRLLAGLATAGARVSEPEQHARFAGLPGPAPKRDTTMDVNVDVIEIDAPISPMLFGLLRPRLLLPRHLRRFEPTQQELIVEHELTHLRRHDLHWMSAGLLLQTLFWFNPFMRLLRAQLSWAQELGCDRAVLQGRPAAQRKAYAAALVAQLKTQQHPMHAAMAFGAVSASTVTERIALIRTPAAPPRRAWSRMAALAALALVVAGSVAFQPALAWRSAPLSASAGAAMELDCTFMTDAATGARLVQHGQCDERVTPASTFNIVVSLMGYDSGILIDEHAPALPFKEGYPDWIPAWRATTDPASWLRHSVLWYAQQVVARLGADRFARYLQQFEYGNQDLSGDPGKNNGLAMAWVSSSLTISPVEQAAFLRKLVNHELPVSAHAVEMTSRIMVTDTLANGWVVRGKTGTASPVLANGKDDATRQYGWYVGWASKAGRTVVFARMVLQPRRQDSYAGWRVKQAFLEALPGHLNKLP